MQSTFNLKTLKLTRTKVVRVISKPDHLTLAVAVLIPGIGYLH
jgi:hypothetical protein